MVLVRSYSRHSCVIRCDAETSGAGQLAGDDLGGALLVGRVAIREEEDHRHGLDALGRELARGVPDGVLVEGHEDLAARAEALRHLEASPARHERCRTPVEHVVHLEEIAAPDLEDVAEALGRDEARPGPCSLEERIDADGRAVDDEAAVRELRARLVDAAEHAVEEIARRAERLAGGDGARGLVEDDQVREGAADVDADSLCHASAPNRGGALGSERAPHKSTSEYRVIPRGWQQARGKAFAITAPAPRTCPHDTAVSSPFPCRAGPRRSRRPAWNPWRSAFARPCCTWFPSTCRSRHRA